MPGCPVSLLGWGAWLSGQWGEAAGVDFHITNATNSVSRSFQIMELFTGLVAQ